MAEDRPFPPSPRRVALARRAGLTALSPLLVGGVACIALVIAAIALVRAAGSRLATAIAAACDHRPATALAPDAIPGTVLALALPLLAAAALAAIVAHLVQTRAVWLPRRRAVPGAPTLPAHRVRRAAFELLAAAVIGVVAFAWLWLLAPRLAALPDAPLASGALVASALSTFAMAWIALGVLDALLRHAALAHALRMTSTEKREDDRLAGADPRWKRQRAARARERVPSLAAATVLVLGDDTAVAIAWHPRRRPIPECIATGRRARATQLLGLARRQRIGVHRDALLADALVDHLGVVPEAHWPRLASLIPSPLPRDISASWRR